MKQKIQSFIRRIADSQTDYRIRLFYVLALGGCSISFLTLLFSLFSCMWLAGLICGVLMLLSFGLICYTHKTGNYRQAYIVTVVTVFMIFFPILFFVSGGHRSGMPSVFLFAVLFTMLMLRGKSAILLSALEIVEYSAACILAYLHPEYVTSFETEGEILIDIILAFGSVSIVCGMVLYFHLKEYDRQRETLHRQNEKLRQYDASRSAFLTTVSHEIKNPLNAINLHAKDTVELTEEQPTDLELIRQNQAVITKMVGRIDRILMDLKDTVAIEQGRLSLHLAPMSMQTMIREAAITYFGKHYTAENKLILNLEETLPPIKADEARLLQVMTNLLSNAMQHTKHGRIAVTLIGIEGGLQICVSDNGEGMPEEIKKKVFEGYVSASEEHWRHGIGLYVCGCIIKAHGGQIWLDSKVGEGTRVFFTLPYKE